MNRIQGVLSRGTFIVGPDAACASGKVGPGAEAVVAFCVTAAVAEDVVLVHMESRDSSRVQNSSWVTGVMLTVQTVHGSSSM